MTEGRSGDDAPRPDPDPTGTASRLGPNSSRAVPEAPHAHPPSTGVRRTGPDHARRRSAPGNVGDEPERGACGHHVVAHLAHERLGGVEAPVRHADALDERHPGRFAVEVAVEVEEEHLEQWALGRGVKRGAAPERGGGGVDRAVGPFVPAGVDPLGRQRHAVGHGHVGRREPELGATSTVAVHHRPPHLVWTPEQRGGTGHVAVRPAARGSGSTTPPASDPSSSRAIPTTSKPCRDPISVSSATLPARRWPKWKSSPTTTRRARRAPTRTSRTKSSAVSLARAWSNGTTTVRSTPVVSSSSSFCSRDVSTGGADSGRTTVAGWRSKVTTTLASPEPRPDAAARRG